MTIPTDPLNETVDEDLQREALEALAASAYGEHESVTEVIRPAAILSEAAARAVLFTLSIRDARAGGEWVADPTAWSLYDAPWASTTDPGSAQLLGTIHVTYGTPTRYEITIFRVTVTAHGTERGWDVVRLCDEAFQHAGLTLDNCPRAQLIDPPRPFRSR